MTGDRKKRKVDVIIIGAGLAAAACAKRLVDAGFETIVLEKKSLPRHKLCSGILSPRGHRFLIENFGPLPRQILHEPTSCRGVTFHFPNMLSLSMDFDGGPTPHLYRKYADYWAIRRSGVEVHDQTRFTALKDKGAYVDVTARREGQSYQYRTKYLVGADGPFSTVIRSIYPNYPKQIPWFVVGQKLHGIIECPLDDDYFHFWFHPKLGYYTWSHARDGRQIVGVGILKGDSFRLAQQRVVDYLEVKHRVKLEPIVDLEACQENFGLSLINRYVFGKDNVIITGQAAGFLNMMAEGMSCALHSGAVAGEAAVEAFRHKRPLQKVYRSMIVSEVRRCSDQWNPFKIIFNHPHEANFWGAIQRHAISDRLRIIGEIIKFMKIYARFDWGSQILWQAVFRHFKGHYMRTKWL